MLRKMGLLVLVGLLTAAAPVRVDDAYTIKLKKSGKGAVTDRMKQDNENSNFKLETDGKVLNEKKESKIVTEEYKETLVEKEKGKRATKIRREYRKAAAKVGDKETTLPYEGKTLLIEKKDGKYHFTIEGGAEVMGKDAEYLNRSFNKSGKDDSLDEDALEKAMMPKKQVAVNGTWALDIEEIAKAMDKDGKSPFPLDKSKAGGKGKLLRAYKKDGRQYGVFEIEANLPLKGEFPLGKDATATIRDGSKMTMHAKVDACIDGTSSDSDAEISMGVDMVATFNGPDGKEYKITIQVNSKGKDVEKDLLKK